MNVYVVIRAKGRIGEIFTVWAYSTRLLDKYDCQVSRRPFN